jgi:hypothetical protein
MVSTQCKDTKMGEVGESSDVLPEYPGLMYRLNCRFIKICVAFVLQSKKKVRESKAGKKNKIL